MIDKKIKIKINIEKCKGCLFCADKCPKDVLELTDQVNKRGAHHITVKYADKCSGCGICVIMCPDCAIEISEE